MVRSGPKYIRDRDGAFCLSQQCSFETNLIKWLAWYQALLRIYKYIEQSNGRR